VEGHLRTIAPPSVSGEVRVGGLVRPVAATWAGGWGRETDWLQLQACRTSEGGDCVVVLDEIKYGRCRPDGGRLLPARYEGRWLRVADTRIDRAQPFTMEGYFAPEGVKPQQPGTAGVASAVVGRIAAGPAPAGSAVNLGRDPASPPPDSTGPSAAPLAAPSPPRSAAQRPAASY
jgi:hypothetical protein